MRIIAQLVSHSQIALVPETINIMWISIYAKNYSTITLFGPLVTSPFTGRVAVSLMSMQEKKTLGACRVIVNLLWLFGASVNDGIQCDMCGIAWNTRCPGCTIAAVLLSFYGHF